MHSATTATGRPLPPPGKSLPKNRPAPLSCRSTRQLADPKPHVTSELQCYIPAPAATRLLRARFAKGHSFTQSAFREGSRITRHSRSNRHTPRLENAISRRKQTLGTPSNRHFLQGSASHNLRIANVDRPPQAASKNVSNRQWQILEINVNLSKQTIAPRSNRHKNAVIKREKFPITTARRWLLPLFLIPNRCITTFGGCTIMLARIKVRKILLVSLVSILLCGMVASELPELLTLTNDTSNDFTVRNTSTAGLRALPDSHRPVRIVAVNSSVPAAILLHSRRSAIETAAPVPSELFILHSVLRT